MAKAVKLLKFSAIILLLAGLIAYVLFAMTALAKPDPEERCQGMELAFNDAAAVNFIDAKEVEAMLKSRGLYPKGKLMCEVDTRSIEQVIRQNVFVEDVECYKTSGGNLRIQIEQRTPVIYIIPDGKDGYYIDKDGKVIPSSVYTSNMVVATGYIPKNFAATELADFGSFLQTDKFWDAQIEQIYLLKGKDGKPLVEIIPRVGNHVVYLGTIDGYEKKLRRLKIFYEKAMGTVGWNKYDRINLEYNNQIICTKSRKRHSGN